MARTGGFTSGGINPFGSTGLGSLGQYDIGSNLAELERYKAEVAWGNGQLSDEEYLAALKKALDAALPDSQAQVTAQNRYDDAVYQIGRKKADAQGLDALIAFDQASLAKMTPDNLKYRSVKSSLDSELAQRRSEDYSKLVLDYNAGKTSTQSLLNWVTTTLAGMPQDAPDRDNWQSTLSDLQDRVKDEADQKAYQDYSAGRLSADKFLAYIQGRRDSYAAGSPKWQDWADKLEDATKSVNDARQSAADAKFFDEYNAGHHSDAEYLAYMKQRISGMKADDPQREEWQARYNQAAFSVAEDQLRFAVEHGTRPVSALVSFYDAYRKTLNPGSAEWRTITDRMEAAANMSVGGGGGGGGSAGGALPQAIGGPINLDTFLHYMTIDPSADKKDLAVATKYFDLNFDSLKTGKQRGDKYWLFYDPTKPGQAVQAVDPVTGKKLTDAKGKPIMVPGSVWLPVTDTALSKLYMLDAQNSYAAAYYDLANNDAAGYAGHLKAALDSEDAGRLFNAQQVQHNNTQRLAAMEKGIELATRTGDAAGVYNLIKSSLESLQDELRNNPGLDETRREWINNKISTLEANPLWVQMGPNGQYVPGFLDMQASTVDADGNIVNAVLNPNVHFVLDNWNSTTGKPEPKWIMPDPGTWDPAKWAQSHLTVHAPYGPQVVTGEVSVGKAEAAPLVYMTMADGSRALVVMKDAVHYIAYPDQYGNIVRAYSVDGVTWVSSRNGAQPVLQANGAGLTMKWVDANGTALAGPMPGATQALVDGSGNIIFTDQSGSWVATSGAGDYFATTRDGLTFLGVGDFQRRSDERGTEPWRDVMSSVAGDYGPQFDVLQTGSDGTLSWVPSWAPAPIVRANPNDFNQARANERGTSAGVDTRQGPRIPVGYNQLRADERGTSSGVASVDVGNALLQKLRSQLPTGTGTYVPGLAVLGPGLSSIVTSLTRAFALPATNHPALQNAASAAAAAAAARAAASMSQAKVTAGSAPAPLALPAAPKPTLPPVPTSKPRGLVNPDVPPKPVTQPPAPAPTPTNVKPTTNTGHGLAAL